MPRRCADSASEFPSTERAYGGRAAHARAQTTLRTVLDYESWIVARTPAFKSWFGDWEAARVIHQLEAEISPKLDYLPALEGSKASFAAAFLKFGSVVNQIDSRRVTFPSSTAGKIYRHKGFDYRLIAGAFDQLFARSVPMLSELEETRERHKNHSSNIQAYHHYLSKFELGGNVLYLRFTVQELKQGRAKQERNEVHSAMVSFASLYLSKAKQGAVLDSSAWGQIASRVITESASRTTPIDRKLATWLVAGNSKPVLGPLHPETGEPLATAINGFLNP